MQNRTEKEQEMNIKRIKKGQESNSPENIKDKGKDWGSNLERDIGIIKEKEDDSASTEYNDTENINIINIKNNRSFWESNLSSNNTGLQNIKEINEISDIWEEDLPGTNIDIKESMLKWGSNSEPEIKSDESVLESSSSITDINRSINKCNESDTVQSNNSVQCNPRVINISTTEISPDTSGSYIQGGTPYNTPKTPGKKNPFKYIPNVETPFNLKIKKYRNKNISMYGNSTTRSNTIKDNTVCSNMPEKEDLEEKDWFRKKRGGRKGKPLSKAAQNLIDSGDICCENYFLTHFQVISTLYSGDYSEVFLVKEIPCENCKNIEKLPNQEILPEEEMTLDSIRMSNEEISGIYEKKNIALSPNREESFSINNKKSSIINRNDQVEQEECGREEIVRTEQEKQEDQAKPELVAKYHSEDILKGLSLAPSPNEKVEHVLGQPTLFSFPNKEIARPVNIPTWSNLLNREIINAGWLSAFPTDSSTNSSFSNASSLLNKEIFWHNNNNNTLAWPTLSSFPNKDVLQPADTPTWSSLLNREILNLPILTAFPNKESLILPNQAFITLTLLPPSHISIPTPVTITLPNPVIFPNIANIPCYSIKISKLGNTKKERLFRLKELKILLRLKNNKHIVELSHSWEENSLLFLKIHYYKWTLKCIIQQKKNLPNIVKYLILLQILAGLKAIHTSNIIHLDIKPENIFISDTNTELVIKIGDFSISRYIYDKTEIESDGDRLYMAPELLNNTCTYNSDIYSTGILFLEILLEIFPIKEKNKDRTLTENEIINTDKLSEDTKANTTEIKNTNKNFNDENSSSNLHNARNTHMAGINTNTKENTESIESNLPHINTEIYNIIQEMIRYKPEDRPSINKIIKVIEKQLEKEHPN
ncbi:hypothetical protein NEIRO03_2079 [Nematocida sp. AWRm78]|nr:hypothetical protein NEIRO03_1533 [Nematocida sp. AWRm78]KAI5185580.1 hypothetical protein NEIRO03_2079 [Nematocida sp. AWRm78]